MPSFAVMGNIVHPFSVEIQAASVQELTDQYIADKLGVNIEDLVIVDVIFLGKLKSVN